ncbi:MAG: CRISPR-associated endonuclease Cas2, partial [Pseudomonadota bacterium]|nr:CRISPR-associated endonuclease Cas2 [Pseudomonadota bacterium]
RPPPPTRKLAASDVPSMRRYSGAMTQRVLYIAAYDVSDPGRLRDALKVLKGYASGRQKSVFECFLTAAERGQLLAQIRAVIDTDEDRFFLLRLDPRTKVRTLGKAVKPADPPWFYVG